MGDASAILRISSCDRAPRLRRFFDPVIPRSPRDFCNHRVSRNFIRRGIGNEHYDCHMATIWQRYNTGIIGCAGQPVYRSRTTRFMRHPRSRWQQPPDTPRTSGSFGQEPEQHLPAGNGKPPAFMEDPKQSGQPFGRSPVSVLGEFVLAHFLFRGRHDDIRQAQLAEIVVHGWRPVQQSQQNVAGGPVTFRNHLPQQVADTEFRAERMRIANRAVLHVCNKIVRRYLNQLLQFAVLLFHLTRRST